MANVDSNTNMYSASRRDIHYSEMAGSLVNISFSEMTQDECLQLAYFCDETHAGLCHCLTFISETINALAQHGETGFNPSGQHHLGHTLATIGQLIPTVADLSLFIRAELQKTEPESLA